MIQLRFENIHADIPRISTWSDSLLRIVGDFEIQVGGEQLYHEEEFCLVELAYQLHQWLTTFQLSELEFEYASMETTENPVLWFRRGRIGWSVGAYHQGKPSPAEVDQTNLIDAVRAYLVELDVKLDDILRVRLLPILLDVGRWQK
jgi:hypothetical protein